MNRTTNVATISDALKQLSADVAQMNREARLKREQTLKQLQKLRDEAKARLKKLEDKLR